MTHPLSGSFIQFAKAECEDSSALYHALSLAIAGDGEILDLAARAASGQPVPNLLFASIHYLLAQKENHPLRFFYGSLNPHPRRPSEAFPSFKDFTRLYRDEILRLLGSRLVQTNEVRRSAYLFPALTLAASLFDSRPLALVEIGTSAGLNLLWDRYQYDYGDGFSYGAVSSPVRITSLFKGALPAILSSNRMPKVSHRIGLDLNIIDASLPDEAAWLRALIWPEHHERRTLMDAALDLRRTMPLDLRAGDGFAMIAGITGKLPAEHLPCIYHTHVANQIPLEARLRLLETIDRIGRERDVIHLFNNIHPHLHLTAWSGGKKIDVPIAKTEGHARWIEWLHPG